jgi:hypothetical protein
LALASHDVRAAPQSEVTVRQTGGSRIDFSATRNIRAAAATKRQQAAQWSMPIEENIRDGQSS